jgi:hypothetical protein
MAVCGLPEPVANHSERMVRMAIRMVHITREHAMEHGVSMKLRVGINSGPVVAGVIGKSKYIYDLWGRQQNDLDRSAAPLSQGRLVLPHLRGRGYRRKSLGSGFPGA